MFVHNNFLINKNNIAINFTNNEIGKNLKSTNKISVNPHAINQENQNEINFGKSSENNFFNSYLKLQEINLNQLNVLLINFKKFHIILIITF